MSMALKGLAAYKQTQVQSRTPLELVVMLYDGVLQSLTSARDAIERRDIPARRDALNKALAIIAELQNTLNMEQGGEISASLDRLYGYSNLRLLDAAMRNDAKPVEEVHHIFTILKDGWQAIAQPGQGAPKP